MSISTRSMGSGVCRRKTDTVTIAVGHSVNFEQCVALVILTSSLCLHDGTCRTGCHVALCIALVDTTTTAVHVRLCDYMMMMMSMLHGLLTQGGWLISNCHDSTILLVCCTKVDLGHHVLPIMYSASSTVEAQQYILPWPLSWHQLL